MANNRLPYNADRSIETKDRNSLAKVFQRLKDQLPGKTAASVYLEICDRKAEAAILLEQIISWWENGTDSVCNWTDYRGTGDSAKTRYMFMSSNDLADMWVGEHVPRRQLDWLVSMNYISLHAGFVNGKKGRLLKVRYQNVVRACQKVVSELLATHTVDSERKSLLVRARTHAPKLVNLYTFQDIILLGVQHAFKNKPDKVLEAVNNLNIGKIETEDFRKVIAKYNPEYGGKPPQNFEPTKLEWAVPKHTSMYEHAGQRLRAISNLFIQADGGPGVNTIGWHPDKALEKSTLSGEFDLFKFQFVAVSYLLNKSVRETLNVNKLGWLKTDLTSAWLACYEHMTIQCEFNKDPWHINQLMFNELYSLGWLESRIKFKHSVRGEVLLEKWLHDNLTYGSTTLLQRLCLFGKLFPDDIAMVRKYVAETEAERFQGRGVASTLKTLGPAQRKILRAMYPSVFSLIEGEARC